MKDAHGHGSDGKGAAHQAGVNSLAAGLHVNWLEGGHNPYTGGGFAAASRARRQDKAAAYIAARAARPSNFKLG